MISRQGEPLSCCSCQRESVGAGSPLVGRLRRPVSSRSDAMVQGEQIQISAATVAKISYFVPGSDPPDGRECVSCLERPRTLDLPHAINPRNGADSYRFRYGTLNASFDRSRQPADRDVAQPNFDLIRPPPFCLGDDFNCPRPLLAIGGKRNPT
jgi:hypothetical protein